MLKKAPTKKATGFDSIDYIVLKEVNNNFPEILYTFYNKCYQLHCFPEPLKKGIIVLFHKDGKEADKIKSYRPVTLLPIIGKVLERILLRRLNHTLKKKSLLYHNQFDFREGRSTDDAIHQLVENIHDAENKKLHTMVISLDIQGAFVLLQYNSVRNSLDEINFLSHTIETLKNILNDMKVTIQRTQGPVSWSQQQGCAQGSFTCPLFWNLVTNEIISQEWQPNVHLQAFADGFIFVISEPTGAKFKATAQAALTNFQHWTEKHQLKVSKEKSTSILISRLVSGPRVKWNNHIIKISTSLKYLGVIIDNKLNWADHLINMKTKLTHIHQQITRVAGTNSGLNKDLRRSITGAYSTKPTAALQVIEGIIQLHIKAEQEVAYVRTARLRKTSNYNNINLNPNNYEDGTISTKFYPAIFQLEDRISLRFLPVPGLNIYADLSKIEYKTGSAFCVMEEDTTKYEWMAQLCSFNTVFQAELLAIQEACLWANKINQQVKVGPDSESSLHSIASIDTKSPIAQQTQEILLKSTNIKLGWIRVHVGYRGNEAADVLAKKATQEGIPTYIPTPRNHIKSLLQNESIIHWQKEWDNGETARTVCDVLPKVKTTPTPWQRPKIMLVMGHGPFPTYLNRFNIRNSDSCGCGNLGSPLHYATN
ncbi:Putative protein in type-1 retrotransposable element R1DM [Araneus ventricosus]|uniref:Retrovirus-related Pol polyprotein from type-1 retrotransposable element R1 n=1 Tax=Araneus ventricosus TaxID=182803 RepID=A0A4Y2A481_ARAVE|nr:Putative protein in type-1 retrotransposable element R1DM [Araneus ventricosus]